MGSRRTIRIVLGATLLIAAPLAAQEAAQEAQEPSSPALQIPVPSRARLDRWIQQMGQTHQSSTRQTLERSGRYESFVRAELQKRGMPQELFYLAMIESEYQTGARSQAQAVGMWQFMRRTAQMMGLEVSTYVDERRDPIRSTDAALRHLDDLHRHFGSWALAAAAYNAGSGRVERALLRTTGRKKGGSESLFWRISRVLPLETQQYLPRWLAASRIAQDPARYGMTDLRYEAALAYDTLAVPGGTSLARVARTLRVSPEELYELNPHLVRRQTPPGRSWQVRVPKFPELKPVVVGLNPEPRRLPLIAVPQVPPRRILAAEKS